MTPIEGVIFDLHHTLLDAGSPTAWLDLAARRLGRPAPADPAVPAFLDDIWRHAHAIDPHARRDTSPAAHREVFATTVAGCPGVDAALAGALHDCLFDVWTAYADAVPTLKALRRKGIRLAVLSNIGLDIRPVLAREGLAELLDAVVLSFEVGSVKPEPAIFEHALRELGLPAERVLMVGDTWRHDGGAGALGVRTLILPRTRGAEHGLDAVLRLVA